MREAVRPADVSLVALRRLGVVRAHGQLFILLPVDLERLTRLRLEIEPCADFFVLGRLWGHMGSSVLIS